MRVRGGSLILVMLASASVGCGSDADNTLIDLGAETFLFDIEEMHFTCGEAVVVDQAGEVFDQLPEEWPVVCGASNDPPPLTGDLEVTARMELDTGEYLGPANCHQNVSGTSCIGPVFVIRPEVSGAKFLESTNGGESEARTKIELQPGKYRLQAKMLWGHPSLILEAQIVIWPSCNADCPEGSLPCKTDQRCYYRSSYAGYEDLEYCLSCLRRPSEECACWTIDGPRADGWNCEWSVGTCGDIGGIGKCEAGVCR